MKFNLEFHMDNASFHDDNDNLETDEIKRILKNIAFLVRLYDAQDINETNNIMDSNGNPIGYWQISE